jgi:hypothetical protein
MLPCGPMGPVTSDASHRSAEAAIFPCLPRSSRDIERIAVQTPHQPTASYSVASGGTTGN